MKILTLLGTRPEIIRLSRIIERLDAAGEHVVVHTGQNFDRALSDIFFDQLGVRSPDVFMGIQGATSMERVGAILAATERALVHHAPDRLLILGDTDSALGSIVAKRLGIPVFHMEAGNRCFDHRVPEETNRRIIDHSSDVLMPYTEHSRRNLLAEGIPAHRILVTGNPILEVLNHIEPQTAASTVLADLGLTPHGYFLVTAHRAENIDVPARLANLHEALVRVSREWALPVVVSCHPRMRKRLNAAGLGDGDGIRMLDPFGLPDFQALQRSARCVLTDSGTVQEECAILHVPNGTLRDVTERPETLECGSNILAGVDPDRVVRSTRLALSRPATWTPPAEYMAQSVSDVVARIVTGHFEGLPKPYGYGG